MFRSLISPRTFTKTVGAVIAPVHHGSNFLRPTSLTPSCFSCLNLLHTSSSKNKEAESFPPTLIEKYKLNDPTRWVPLTIGSFVTASVTGLYHWDAESQMLGLFILFVGTIYTQGGKAIGGYFDDIAENILKEHQAVEDAQINAVEATLLAHKRQLAIYEEIKSIFEEQKKVIEEIKTSADKQLVYEMRSEFVKRLDNVLLFEQETSDKLQKNLIDNATAFVLNSFTNDLNLQKDSLNNALNFLDSPSQQMTVDDVGQKFQKYFSDYRAKLKEMEGKTVELSEEMRRSVQEDMDKIAKRDGLKSKYQVPKTIVFHGV